MTRRLPPRTPSPIRVDQSPRRAFAVAAAPDVDLVARVGISPHEFPVRDLTPDGFTVMHPVPLAANTLTHVCFRLPGGVSISLQAIAQATAAEATRQRFVFANVDRDALNLLLLSVETSRVH